MPVKILQMMPAEGWFSRHLYNWGKHKTEPKVVYCPLVCWALVEENGQSGTPVYGFIASELEDQDESWREEAYCGDIYPAKETGSFLGYVRKEDIENDRKAVESFFEGAKQEIAPPTSDAEVRARRDMFKVLGEDGGTQ
jgi:hypothetical protein